MAKTITETADQQTSGPGSERVKLRSDKASTDGLGLSRVGGGQVERFRSFLTDVRAEMHKVTTPSREEVRSTTIVVVATVFLFAGYFAIVDYVVGQGITRLIQHFSAH